MQLTRRQWLGGLTAGAAIALGGTARAEVEKAISLKKFKNEDFYKPDGSFNADAAKEAYYNLMWFYHYPIVDRLKGPDFWVTDFGLGKFLETGMGGIFWINNKQDDYMGHEIFVLPNQALPEHTHVKTPDARPKAEAWHARYGWVYLYSEGEPTPGVDARIPPCQKEFVKAKTEKKLMPGEASILAVPGTWHWMLAGPEGAIVTEYASYHDGKALRFTHPKVKL